MFSKHQQQRKMSDRRFRNTFPRTSQPLKLDNPSKFAKMEPGTYGPVTLNADGSILIDASAYADDVLAFVLGAIVGNPSIGITIKHKLATVLDEFDERAVSIHGYSESPEERDFKWEPVVQAYYDKVD